MIVLGYQRSRVVARGYTWSHMVARDRSGGSPNGTFLLVVVFKEAATGLDFGHRCSRKVILRCLLIINRPTEQVTYGHT